MPRHSRKPTGRSRSSPSRPRYGCSAPGSAAAQAIAAGAMADVESGLALAPGDARLQTLRGRLLIEEGRPVAGLAALDRALAAGAGGQRARCQSPALWELARYQESIAEWTLALRDDPEDADAFLGRRTLFRQARPLGARARRPGECGRLVVRSTGGSGARAALAYASCLAQRPNRLSRALGLAAGAASGWRL